ncbi:MAG: leucine-rich repeat domain-containing protein [Flavobacteriales bacterium]
MFRLLLFLFCLPLFTSGQTLRFIIADPVAVNTSPTGPQIVATGPSAFTEVIARQGIDWSAQGLKRMPSALDTLGWRPYVDLRDNRLRKLPERASTMRVDTLLLSGNRLGHRMQRTNAWMHRPSKATAGLPRAVSYLDASHNELTWFQLTGLPNATYVDLSWNDITSCYGAGCKGSNVKLDTLILRGNALTELNASFEGFGGLRYLDASNNNITGKGQLRAKYMRSLEVLDLSNNNISKVSRKWRRFPSLRTIDLRGNPLNEKEAERARSMFAPGVEVLTD